MDWSRFQMMLSDVRPGVSQVDALNIFRECCAATKAEQPQGDDFATLAIYWELHRHPSA